MYLSTSFPQQQNTIFCLSNENFTYTCPFNTIQQCLKWFYSYYYLNTQKGLVRELRKSLSARFYSKKHRETEAPTDAELKLLYYKFYDLLQTQR